MKLKIKPNDKLFHKFKVLSEIVYNLSFIVHNDLDIEEEDITEWNKHFKSVQKDLNKIHNEVIEYIKESN